MLKCIVIDDEKPAADEMVYMLSQFEDVEVVETFTDCMTFVSAIEKYRGHILFLDINMPKISGLLIADHIIKNNIPIRIVFVTAYDTYAIKAFEVNAVDYLLKPVEKERLAQTIARLAEGVSEDTVNLKAMVKDYKQHQQVMSLYRDGILKPIKYEDISLIYFEDRTTHFITKHGLYSCKKNLSELEDILSENFFRCHRAYIINLDCIESIEPWFNNTFMVVVRGHKEQVPISRGNVNAFKEKMHIF
ncbi:response regulator transcription factor [Fusibacter paucivorans]|uniref:Stage 0 sporulation protein A homolog n=1 Tax=Fusibacter paucivorans TaxID=76009 RepID=A0ABS5PKR0_9FIRM|nr:LytTR family DNA-binding domain-containing protein [Fusibacter paucivorans]MBS7525758.1 response regulator transcription factor [Fusibacter paucivorans]